MRWLAVVSLCLAGCLDPLVSDDLTAGQLFGPADVEPEDVVHVEDVPEFASRVAGFPDRIEYLSAYADGREVRYWNIPGDTATFIAQVYVLRDTAGSMIGRPIIDVLPGDGGYSPFWRVVIVRATAAYAGERIWSRESIDLGVELGLFEPVEAQTTVLDCPVVQRGTKVPLGGSETESTWVWYRNMRVDWVRFSEAIDVPTDVTLMPRYPVWQVQRIDEAFAIHESDSGVDENGDGVLDASNNIFASGLDGERYSPLWSTGTVRTVSSYRSIDTAGRVGLTAESDFYDVAAGTVIPSARAGTSSTGVVISATLDEDDLTNCPVQRRPGEL